MRLFALVATLLVPAASLAGTVADKSLGDEAVPEAWWLPIGETRMADFRLIQAKMSNETESEDAPRWLAQLEIEKFLYRRDRVKVRAVSEPALAPLFALQGRYWEIRARKRNAEFRRDHAQARGADKASRAAAREVQRWEGEMADVVPKMQKMEKDMGDPPGARTER